MTINEKNFIKEEKRLRIENDARLLADLIYLNYKYLDNKNVSVISIYKTLHDVIIYSQEEEKKIFRQAIMDLRVYYRLELDN